MTPSHAIWSIAVAHPVDRFDAVALPPELGAQTRDVLFGRDGLAAALAARGIVKGDRILVHSKNGDEMFWSMFAAFRLGAVWVPTNFRLMPDEVAYLATASGAKAFLCHGDFPEHGFSAYYHHD